MKKHIVAPVVRVIQIDGLDIICSSPGVNDTKGNGIQLAPERNGAGIWE